ncbi:MAG: tetratricopeptide repeat protein [Candidatus Scalindua sp.]
MKNNNTSKTRQYSFLLVKKLFIISIVCLLILQKSTPSSAISILTVEPSVIELQNQAYFDLRRGKFLDVFKKCDELLTINKKSTLAYELLCVSYAGIGKYDKAQELIESLKYVPKDSSLLHLSKGMILHSQQKFDEAIAECQKSVTIDQDNPLAFYVIGRIYIDKKEFGKAEEHLRKAVEKEPELAAAYTGLGVNYLLQRNMGEAFENYNKALEIDQDEHMARMGLATIFIGLKGYENAIEQYNLVIKKMPTFIRARQNLAALYLQIGRFKDAIEQSSEILNIDTKIAPVYLILARSHSYTNNFDDAVKNIRKFIDLQGSSYEGHYLLGVFLMASGDNESAKDALEKAGSIDAEQGNIMMANALINHIEGNYNTAEVFLKKALSLTRDTNNQIINMFLTNLYLTQEKQAPSKESLNISGGFIDGFRPDNLDLKSDSKTSQSFAHTNLAIFFYLNKWYDKAIKTCDAALAIHPDNPITLYVKGKSFIDKKDFSQALLQFKKIVETQPDFLSPHYDLARIYFVMGDNDKAVEEYKRTAELDPKDASAHLSIGNIYSRQGKNDEAIAEYKQFLAMAPDSPIGYNELAYNYAESETNLDEGLEYALKAARLAPKDASILDTLGWVYFKKGNLEKALENLKSAVESGPNSPTIRYHLGMAHYRNSDLNNALNEFNNSLSISGRFNESSQSKKMIRLIGSQLSQTQ